MAKSSKRITLVIHGADRRLWTGGTIRIVVRDLFRGQDIHSSDVFASVVELKLDLPFDAGQLYGIRLLHPDHRPAWAAVSRQSFLRGTPAAETSAIILRPMLVPDDAASFDLAGGWGRLLVRNSPFTAAGTGVTQTTYAHFPPADQAEREDPRFGDTCRMAFLNMEAKLRATAASGQPLLPLVRGVRQVRRDRVLLWMAQAAKELVAADGASFSRHPGHPGHPHSWKHVGFSEGNVQLSFAAQPVDVAGPNGSTEPCVSVDVDIDLATGVGHWAEWLRNNVFQPGHKTNQVEVYALLWAQGVLPEYTLSSNVLFASAA